MRTKTPPQVKALRALFSKPSKMEGFAFSISALDCITGSKLRETEPGSVCASCYARKGRYVFPNVQAAMARRWDYMAELIKAHKGQGFESWDYHVETWKQALQGQSVFRWHDSGDIQSLGHLRVIVAIAEACPWVSFWLPTKEQGVIAKYTREGAIPDNLCIRISAQIVGEKPPTIAGCTGSMVREGAGHAEGFECPATFGDDHTCKGNQCRACYSQAVPLVIYKKH